MENFPPDLDGTFDNLEVLDLSDNNFRDIPGSMCDFPKLGEVDLQVIKLFPNGNLQATGSLHK